MWKKFIKDYLTFTAKERKGIFVLLSLLGLLIIAPFFFPLFITHRVIIDDQFKNEIARLQIDSGNNFKYGQNDFEFEDNSRDYKRNNLPQESFAFDPNTATVAEWMRLGVKEKIANNIQKYISKGGKFRKPEDLKKIWGIPPGTLDHLLPLVQIAPNNEFSQNQKWDTSRHYTPYKPKEIASIDINASDSTDWLTLPGIGPGYSGRIVRFRNRLGGFYSIDQVGETFMLPDSTFQKIKKYLVLNSMNLKKININTATIEELKSHPYIRYNIGNAIIQYKNQHGAYQSLESLKKIMIITDEVFAKIVPYLTIE